MDTQPFQIFRPFTVVLGTALFTKEDDIRSDTEAAKKLEIQKTASLHQVHGRNVVLVREPSDRIIEADAMITDVPDLALCIRWADCQNFAVFALEKKILGVIHASWKGMRDGMLPAFFQKLNDEFGIEGKDCSVGAGPSLCTKCADFTDPHKEIPTAPSAFVQGKNVDLRGWADSLIRAEGVERFERHPDCTRCNPEKYWTYRGGDREEVKKGHTNMLVASLLASDT